MRWALAQRTRWSWAFDARLPKVYQVDGNKDFAYSFAHPTFDRSSLSMTWTGGGKQPLIDGTSKDEMRLRVIGLDIDENELTPTPARYYDETVCADITKHRGRGDVDLPGAAWICQRLWRCDLGDRHDTEARRSGGDFVPSRNAVFARLNLLLPEGLKKLLYSIYPESRRGQGFRSFYDKCTPRQFRQLASERGLEVVGERLYYSSKYFTFLFPLHLLWRCWVIGFRSIAPASAAETFSMALRKG